MQEFPSTISARQARRRRLFIEWSLLLGILAGLGFFLALAEVVVADIRQVSPETEVRVTVIELAAGVFSGLGALVLFLGGGTGFAFLGAWFATLALLMLFFGQRLAKDYAGAAVLVNYFLLSLAGLYMFA